MLVGLLSFIFTFCSILLILLVLIQKGKSGLGIGSLGGGQQQLFGGSGGQDIFQKATWVLGAILMFGSLGLSIYKSKQAGANLGSAYKQVTKKQSAIPVPASTD
jgi:protein translocase SecG subunit